MERSVRSKEAAEILGITVQQLRDRTARGQIQAWRVGRGWRYLPSLLKVHPTGTFKMTWWHKRNYNLTLADYEKMYAEQQGRCAICGDWYHRLHVDHDHESGGPRKLLCRKCNIGLGHFNDSPDRLEAAAKYLRENSTATTPL